MDCDKLNKQSSRTVLFPRKSWNDTIMREKKLDFLFIKYATLFLDLWNLTCFEKH